jgi:hypothetical protein
VPDWRLGIDNTPGAWVNRGWRTNLHTGRTDDEGFAGTGWSYPYPDHGAGPHFNWFELDKPFYAWASVIVNGRVVATDYAPDAGWLKATPDAKLGGTYLFEDPLVSSGPMRVSSVPLRLSMTVPDDWTVGGPWSRESGREPENTSLEFWTVEHPWDGCPDTVEPKLGPSFDDLVTYLADDVPQIDISESTDVTIDGYRGKHLRYSDVDKWFDCVLGSPIPSSRHSEAWILDVDGVRLVIAALSGDAPSDPVRSEVRQIVESIQIVGVWPSVPASPSPSPTPRATPFPPADGPIPPNARTWKVTVINDSSEPATLFVADEVDDDGRMARLIGSANPNVVPPGATELVTFRLPAKGVEGWSIFVNPEPEGGGLVGWGEVPLPGQIVIENGQPTWRSP